MPTQTTRRRVAAAIVGAVLVVLGFAMTPSAAQAHSGPYELRVSTDGAGGLNLTAQYVEDQHVVDAIMDPVATATATDGRTAGPVPLISSSEGEGLWITEEPFLDEGQWSVTVTTTTPEAATVTVDMAVVPLADAPATTAETQSTAEADGGALTAWLWVIVAVVAVAVVAAWFLVGRRRSGAASAPAKQKTDAPGGTKSS
ncbi:hypothetical protein [Compostimonas suwonensis]|uniref:CopC domain-containing protein n=1 Tax=Compostimonas suwonensis TaxID=1048394 RepID=A0A2M9BWU5_9MICO|nr:hypothetical protein [Compostimonas suwonensis]PJJ62422.1 hypothetical protein CLV54_2225 [Compostimonas suwonensis]